MNNYPDYISIFNFRIKNYIGIIFFISLLIAITCGYIIPIEDKYIIGFQLISISVYLISIFSFIKINERQLFSGIFLYQLFFSFLLLIFFLTHVGSELGYNAVDSKLYQSLGLNLRGLNFSQSFEYLKKENFGLSDYGFPIFMKLIYTISDIPLLNHIILILINCIFQLFTCIGLSKICNILINNQNINKWILILWGFNPCSIWLNVSGLKEPLFCTICTFAMLYIYRSHLNKNFINISRALFWIILTFFFRYYMTIFFIFIFIGYTLLYKMFTKNIWPIVIGSTTLCLGFTFLLASYFPAIYFVMLKSEEILPSGFFKYIYYILAFFSPIPKFYSMDTPHLILISGYSIIKFYFSIFFIVGSYYMIKKKETRFYPLICICLFTYLMLIVSAHYVDYRYPYPIMPCFFLLMVYGMKYYKKTITSLWLIFGSCIVLLFNLKFY